VLDVGGDTFDWCDISDVGLSKIVHQSHLWIRSQVDKHDDERIRYRSAIYLNTSTDVKWSICSDGGDHHGYHCHAIHVVSHTGIAKGSAQDEALQKCHCFRHTSLAVEHLPESSLIAFESDERVTSCILATDTS
jgi:hypothetical protein